MNTRTIHSLRCEGPCKAIEQKLESVAAMSGLPHKWLDDFDRANDADDLEALIEASK